MEDKAGFTLSLDCEGLWGMADQPSVVQAGEINDRSLADTYEFIRCTLDAAGVRSTAAFVSAFAVEADALIQELPLLEQLAGYAPAWFAHVLPALQSRQLNGWRGAGFYKAFQRDGHEMAWHGATHMALSDDTPQAAIELEIQLAQRLLPQLGALPRSIVFPRNKVGHLEPLARAGFETYRASPPAGLLGRVSGLANEWRFMDGRVSAKPAAANGWHISPAGFFLNWPSGARSWVPLNVTVKRWESLLRAAASTGGYVHIWFHPHNLITAPAMKTSFAKIMNTVGELIRSGDMCSLTMAEANGHFAKGTQGKFA